MLRNAFKGQQKENFKLSVFFCYLALRKGGIKGENKKNVMWYEDAP